jgi:hypothetical protein
MATDRDQNGDQDGSGIQKRRERYGMLWEDLFREEMKTPIVPGSPEFEAMRAGLRFFNEMMGHAAEAFREPAPEPPKAEDLDSLIDSITEHSGPIHILPGPHVEEVVREVIAAEDIEAGDAVYLKPDGTVGLSDEQIFERLSTRLRAHTERMQGAAEPASEPPKDATEAQPPDDGLTWRQKPGLL